MWATHRGTRTNKQRQAELEADVCWLISIMFLCTVRLRENLRSVQKQREKPQVPGRPLVLENTKQRGTCVCVCVCALLNWRLQGFVEERTTQSSHHWGYKAWIQMSVGYTGMAFNFLYFSLFRKTHCHLSESCRGGEQKTQSPKPLSHLKAR